MLDKILKIFYNDLTSQFTINELSKKIKVSYSYVYGQVENLRQKGVMLIEQQSKRKYCRPNYSHPEVRTAFVAISNELSQEFLRKQDKITFVVNRLLSELPKKTDFNLLSIVLFGSLAKGADTKKSDMDLFVLVPSKDTYDEPIEMECAALSREFGIEINPIISEPANLLSMLKDNEPNVGKEILKNKIVLFGAEKFWELIFEVIK